MTADRQVGETFTAEGVRWTVYAIKPDETVCSRHAGKASSKQAPSSDPTIDYSRTCSFRTNHKNHRYAQCDKHVLKGTTLCREHQWAKRYAVID